VQEGDEGRLRRRADVCVGDGDVFLLLLGQSLHILVTGIQRKD
jgi:hypothetical protein